MARKGAYVARSWQGVHRDENKDDWLVLDARDSRLHVVFDGVSSTKNARAVVGATKTYLENEFDICAAGECMLDALFYEANNTLLPQHVEDGASTYVALLYNIKERTISISHLGDSRIYRIDEKKFIQLTDDHALPDKSHIITKSLGMGDIARNDFYTKKLPEEAGRFLLCTDGFYEFIERVPEMPDIIREEALKNIPKKAAKHIQDNNSDDATFMVIDIQ